MRPKSSIGRMICWYAAAGAAALLASVSVAALSAGAQNQMKFAAAQMDVELDGEFRRFSADVDFNPAKLGSARVNIDIDLSSVDTGSADADALLKGKGFFDTAHFPRATFSAAAIKAAGQGKYVATGPFTLKGHTATLDVPFAMRADGAGAWFEGSVPISRLAYHVGDGEWTDTGTLADEVKVQFKVYVPR